MFTNPNVPSRCAQIYYKTILYKRIEMKSRTAARLVRTEITAAAAEGELQALKDKEEEFGVKMRYRFYATLDERTCPVCGELDLQDFDPADAKEGENKPPMHPNCRCVIQPAMDGETKENIIRRGRDEDGKGKVMPAGMTYKDWKEEYGQGAKNATAEPKDKPAIGLFMGGSEKPETTDSSKSTEKEKYDDLVKMMDKQGIELIDAEKADFGLMKDSLEELSASLERSPWAGVDLKSVRVVDSIEGDAYAQTVIIERNGKFFTEIQLNKNWYGDREMFEDIVNYKTSIGDFVKGTTASNIINHELGHSMHISASKARGLFDNVTDIETAMKISADDTMKTISEMAKKRKMDAMSDDWMFKVVDDVSRYGSSRPWETVAESYNNVDINGKKASELSEEIYKWYEDILKKR